MPPRRDFLPYEEAMIQAKSLGIKTSIDWREWVKSGNKPDNLPSYPEDVYMGKGWVNWSVFLGVKNRRNPVYRSFEEAKAFVLTLDLTTQIEYFAWSKTKAKPDDIPSNPYSVYIGKGWVNWSDYLSTEYKRKGHYKPFEDARRFAQTLKLKGQKEWRIWAKTDERPEYIPPNPEGIYKAKGWTNWGDFLGTGNIAKQNMSYVSFEEAKVYMQSQNVYSQSQYTIWSKSSQRPKNIPSTPSKTYKNKGWKGWGDFLATGNVRTTDKEFIDFPTLKNIVRENNLKTKEQYYNFRSKHPELKMPYRPDVIYKQETP
jgi:hypothetical protein